MNKCVSLRSNQVEESSFVYLFARWLASEHGEIRLPPELPDRDQAIAAAYASGGYTLKEIGDHFSLHYAQISRIVRAAEEAKSKT